MLSMLLPPSYPHRYLTNNIQPEAPDPGQRYTAGMAGVHLVRLSEPWALHVFQVVSTPRRTPKEPENLEPAPPIADYIAPAKTFCQPCMENTYSDMQFRLSRDSSPHEAVQRVREEENAVKAENQARQLVP